MGLFDKIFGNKTQQSKPTEIKQHSELYDILFDWCNQYNLRLNDFENDFYPKIEKCYNEDERTQLTDEGIVNLKLFALIIYLTYHKPDVNYIDKALHYILDKENGSYYIKEEIKRYDRRIFDSVPEIKAIVETSSIILKLEGVVLNINTNFSYLSSVISTIGDLKHEESEMFPKVFEFLKSIKSNKKPYLLMGIYTYSGYSYTKEKVSKYQDEVKKECLVAIDEYNQNETHECKLDFELYYDFIEEENIRENSKKWEDTPYAKRRFLKPEDLEETQKFLNKYQENGKSFIFHCIYHYREEYISEPNFYKKIIAFFIKRIAFDREWFEYILSIDEKRDKFFVSEIYTELLSEFLPEIKYTDELRSLYEKVLYESVGYYDDSPCKKGIKLLKKICENTIEDKKLKDFLSLKYSDYFGYITKHPSMSNFVIDDKFNSIKKAIDDINILTPISLKNVKKIYEDGTIIKINVNIDNTDCEISVGDFNALLEKKLTGFRFTFIPIQASKRADEDVILCSFAFLNKKQFEYLTEVYIPENFKEINTLHLYGYLNYYIDSDLTFEEVKQKRLITKNTKDNSFETDQNWSWFKQKYIDLLPNKKEWYKIMDIILDVKGSKTPNKTWAKSIQKAIEKHNTQKYFKELNTLISSSIKEDFWFFGENRKFMKAFIWTCQFFPTENSLLVLKKIIEGAYTKIRGVGPRCAAIGNLGLTTLAEINSTESFGILQLLRNKTKYQRFIKQIDKSIDLFKENSDEPEELLADKSIPNFGFKNGVKKVKYPDFEIEYYFKNQRLAKRWILNGKSYATTPKEIKGNYPEIEKEITEEFKSVNTVFKSLKGRIRSFWLNDRTWKYSDWNLYVLNNQLLNPWLQNLIWKNETTNESFILLENELISIENKKVNISENDIISLWHPVTSDAQELQKWQNFLIKKKIEQTERQVFREFYPFSEKELSLKDSPRFNNHFLNVDKLMGVANSVGWIFTYVHEDVNWPRIYIKPLDITAHLQCDYSRYDFAIPTQGMFFTKGNTTKISYNSKFDKLSLSELPLKFLSEICRDIDLFIATTSVANDPELVEKNDLLKSYRQDYNYGIFSENASSKIRKTVIELISDKIDLKNIAFEGNFLIIKGQLNTYRINLGSGFVQLKDSKRHINLFIEPKSVKKTVLPIKDDETLNVILAKALFLQNDDKISDEELVKQIKEN